jgi:hypothetical protein
MAYLFHLKSRIISDVCNAVCMNMNNIVFPSTNEELRQVKDGFHSIANFPNVAGAIDGYEELQRF